MTTAFELLDEQNEFLVINKAPGVSFHREGEEPGILERVEQQTGISPLWPVHRLDKMTSGLLLIARSAEACAELTEQFRLRRVEKYYLALSHAKPKKKQGKIVGDLLKSRNGSYKLANSRENPSITQFFSTSAGVGLRLFLLKPHTGKTHQLRVVMKSLGAPILGDQRYGGAVADRGYLHAFGICFSAFGREFRYTCIPEDGQFSEGTCLPEGWDAPWLLNWP